MAAAQEKLTEITDAWLQAKYTITGAGYVDFAVMRGDPSDGLPGVKGIGEKTAAQLIGKYGDLDGIVANAANLSSGVQRSLAAAVDYLGPAREVVTAARGVPLPEVDLAYLDPPYNQHQYGANYHLLNTVALWDKPEIPARFGPQDRGIKAGIRRDWRCGRNSAFCHTATAADELRRLLGRLKSRWVLMSYSTDGCIGVEDLVRTLAEAGGISWVYRPYKRYRVSSQRPSSRGHNLEFVLIVDTHAATRPEAAERIIQTCLRRAQDMETQQEALEL